MMETQGLHAPLLVEMTSYHNRAGCIETGTFLPGGDAREIFALPAGSRKRRMLDQYASQARVLRSFAGGGEHFRLAPDYDFTLPPHLGELYYEMFDWGMTGARWRTLAADAIESLEAAKWR
jgi:hypothetical protein